MRDWNVEIDKIINGDYIKGIKMVRFYAIAMLNYRQPIGDRALDEMAKIIGKDIFMEFMYLCGFLQAGNHSEKDFMRLGNFD